MNKLKTFVASGILVLCMSIVALADGGITQVPGFTNPPPPPNVASCPAANDNNCSEPSNSQANTFATDLTSLVAWLAGSIL